ncbi:SpoIIE family protein phosphatase [candidate division KSB1 bacterium]|nr:SpoIIE family protein phosphatase [candidate division KSB1 bacterium]
MTPEHKKIAILALAGLLVLASVVVSSWGLIIWAKTGWIGMRVSHEKMVSEIFHGGSAEKAGIQAEDSVLAISGISANDTTRLQEITAHIEAGDTLSYQIKRGKQELVFPLILTSPLKARAIIIDFLTSILVGAVFLVIGILVLRKKPQDPRAFIFFLMSAIASAFFFAAYEHKPVLGFDVARSWTIAQIVITAMQGIAVLLLPSLFLHFALVFPKERPIVKKHPHIFIRIYGLTALVGITAAALIATKGTVARSSEGDATLLLFLIVGLTVLLWFLFYTIATCVALFRSYRESGVEEKQQVRWPLWGTLLVVSCPFVVPIVKTAWAAFQGRWVEINISIGYEGVPNLIYLLIPISFAFGILKYRLMDIDLIIKKTIIYALVTSIVLALYFVLVAGVGNLLVKYTGIQSQLVTIISTLFIAALFVPVRNRVQNVVDRRFFRKKYDYPTALKTLSREISQAVDQQAMLKLVVEQLQPALQNRSVAIFSRGTYDRAYVATAKVGLPDEILGQLKFEVDSRLLTMMDSPFEVQTKELSEAEKLTLRKAGSAFIVPIKLKSELIAFISLGTKLSDEDYDAEDKDFLTSVAEQMATGFDRVRLREQERDFEKAREIQQGLLPKQIPQLSGYEIACAWQPARAVAGDYYDVIKLSENSLGICIADVVGKGMPAALLMSNLQAIVRAMASEDMPPKQLSEKVNRVISNNITPGKFITFFYCLLDAQNKKLVYTNAGHNRPILFHQDGSWIELKAGGLALGMSRERTFEQGEIELNSGDRLLLFTDGVTEVVNAEREEFGEARLIELLINNRSFGVAELQKRVMDTVTAFCGGDFQDDVTMVVVGVK